LSYLSVKTHQAYMHVYFHLSFIVNISQAYTLWSSVKTCRVNKYSVSQKNATTSENCSFVKHGPKMVPGQ